MTENSELDLTKNLLPTNPFIWNELSIPSTTNFPLKLLLKQIIIYFLKSLPNLLILINISLFYLSNIYALKR